MITEEVSQATLDEWKAIYSRCAGSLTPNRKSGNALDEYFRQKYSCCAVQSRELELVVSESILLNAHSREKLPAGTAPNVKTYFTGNVFVGIDLVSGEFHVECEDICLAAAIYDDLFAFRGLDEIDLKNYVLVAQYVLLTQKEQRAQTPAEEEGSTKYPYGYCGMPCALCSRYRTNGDSRCPGCSCDGYYTDVCKVHKCCREKKIDHCGSCDVFPCERLGKMGDFSDLNTNHVKQRTCAAVKRDGLGFWHKEYAERADMLTVALERYNDGRMKRYLCELFITQDIDTLRNIMRGAEALQGTPKEIAKAFKNLVNALTN